jgi:hypothetical protein
MLVSIHPSHKLGNDRRTLASLTFLAKRARGPTVTFSALNLGMDRMVAAVFNAAASLKDLISLFLLEM